MYNKSDVSSWHQKKRIYCLLLRFIHCHRFFSASSADGSGITRPISKLLNKRFCRRFLFFSLFASSAEVNTSSLFLCVINLVIKHPKYINCRRAFMCDTKATLCCLWIRSWMLWQCHALSLVEIENLLASGQWYLLFGDTFIKRFSLHIQKAREYTKAMDMECYQ